MVQLNGHSVVNQAEETSFFVMLNTYLGVFGSNFNSSEVAIQFLVFESST